MFSGDDSEGYTSEQADENKAANADFLLRWHPCGGWCKKGRGRVYYRGRVTPDAALERYLHERDYLKCGELAPRLRSDRHNHKRTRQRVFGGKGNADRIW